MTDRNGDYVAECDNVCIGDSNVDHPEFYSVRTSVARKATKCCECDGTIEVGAKFFRVAGKWESVFSTFNQCWPCHEIQDVFSCGHGFYYGGLWETWQENDAFARLTVSNPCFRKLSPETRRFLVKRWWAWMERTL